MKKKTALYLNFLSTVWSLIPDGALGKWLEKKQTKKTSQKTKEPTQTTKSVGYLNVWAEMWSKCCKRLFNIQV